MKEGAEIQAMVRNGKSISQDEVEKVTFRLFPPYTELVAEQARAVRLSPNQFARVATMALADNRLLDLHDRMSRIEEALIRLRKDFNDAVD